MKVWAGGEDEVGVGREDRQDGVGRRRGHGCWEKEQLGLNPRFGGRGKRGNLRHTPFSPLCFQPNPVSLSLSTPPFLTLSQPLIMATNITFHPGGTSETRCFAATRWRRLLLTGPQTPCPDLSVPLTSFVHTTSRHC